MRSSLLRLSILIFLPSMDITSSCAKVDSQDIAVPEEIEELDLAV